MFIAEIPDIIASSSMKTDEASQIIRGTWALNGGYLDRLQGRLTAEKPIPLVPFIGAGLSIPMEFPSWSAFLTQLVAR